MAIDGTRTGDVDQRVKDIQDRVEDLGNRVQAFSTTSILLEQGTQAHLDRVQQLRDLERSLSLEIAIEKARVEAMCREIASLLSR